MADIAVIDGVVIGVLILAKLIFWITWYYCRRKRLKRLVEAGLVRPAPQPGETTVVNINGYNNLGYNTTPSMGFVAAPPPYEHVAKSTGNSSVPPMPPSYQEAVGVKHVP